MAGVANIAIANQSSKKKNFIVVIAKLKKSKGNQSTFSFLCILYLQFCCRLEIEYRVRVTPVCHALQFSSVTDFYNFGLPYQCIL
jgi:hypothetical protein